jgi:hypothetical protein
MTCYDIDRFRSFVASDSFSSIYDVPGDESRETLVDDVALLQFGFRCLRQVLFGENTIAVHEHSAEQRQPGGRRAAPADRAGSG